MSQHKEKMQQQNVEIPEFKDNLFLAKIRVW